MENKYTPGLFIGNHKNKFELVDIFSAEKVTQNVILSMFDKYKVILTP